MKSALFNLAKEAVAIPEEGSTEPGVVNEQADLMAQDAQDDLQEPPSKEQVPSEQNEDTPEPAAEPEAKEGPADAPEEDQESAQDEQSEEQEGPEVQDQSDSEAAGEVERMVITIEALLEQLKEPGADALTRSVIDTCASSLASSMGAEPVLVPATESMASWSRSTRAGLEALLPHLHRGRAMACEGIWEGILALFGDTTSKLKALKSQAADAKANVQKRPDFTLSVNTRTLPGLVQIKARSGNHLVHAVEDITASFHEVGEFLANAVHGKLTEGKTWYAPLKSALKHGGHDSEGGLDLSNGTGFEGLRGTFGQSAKALATYSEAVIWERAHEHVDVELDQKGMLEVIEACSRAVDVLSSGVIYFEKAQERVSAQGAQPSAALASLASTAMRSLLPRAMWSIKSALALAK